MTDGPATLRVATFNIRAAIGPGPFPDAWWRRIESDRLEHIAELIVGFDADLVALQEVALLALDGRIVDNAGDLARQTGYEMRYAATRHFPIAEPDGRTSGAGLFGNALLARLPIRSARSVALPAAPPDAFVEPPGADHPAAGVRYVDAPRTIREPRCLLVCDVEHGGAALTVGSVHFSHVGSGERRLQAQACASVLADAPGPVVLAGDLNAQVESPELAPLAVLTDAFTARGIPPGDPRRASSDEGWRIDHVLLRGLEVRDVRVAREAGDASDHWPVVADLVSPA